MLAAAPVCSHKTFTQLIRDMIIIVAVIWLARCTQIKMYSWDNAQVVLVGNKCDLEDERVVTTDRGHKLAERLGNIIRWLSSSHSLWVAYFIRFVSVMCFESLSLAELPVMSRSIWVTLGDSLTISSRSLSCFSYSNTVVVTFNKDTSCSGNNSLYLVSYELE